MPFLTEIAMLISAVLIAATLLSAPTPKKVRVVSRSRKETK
ncbi:MAG: hypothetical protein ACRBBQ_07780 [Cognatishimia sp.]